MTNFCDDIMEPAYLDAQNADDDAIVGHFAIARSLYMIAEAIDRISASFPVNAQDVTALAKCLRRGWEIDQ